MKRRTSADPSPSRLTRSPQVLRPCLRYGAEQRQVVPRRAEVVVDDVLHDAEPRGVAGVDEALVRRRPAVRLGDGEPVDAVVAPVVRAVEGVDRHQLDQVDADRAQVVELPDRGVEGAVGGERADVQLVDHRARQLPAGPGLVGPGERGRVVGSRALVDARRLAPRPRVGSWHVRVVDQVSVVESAPSRRVRNVTVGDPPVASRAASSRRCASPTDRRSRVARGAPHRERRRGRGSRGSSGLLPEQQGDRVVGEQLVERRVAGVLAPGQQVRPAAVGQRTAPCRPSRARPVRPAAGSPP